MAIDFQNLGKYPTEIIKKWLIQVAIIPEKYENDSTDEKRWANAGEKLVAEGFRRLGVKCRADGRSGLPDLITEENEPISLVGDSKTGRRRRAPYSQKDFKMDTVARWKHEYKTEFGLVLAPMHVFHNHRGTLYKLADMHNIAVMSYGQLVCLLNYWKPEFSLRKILDVPHQTNPMCSDSYWRSNFDRTCNVLGISYDQLFFFIEEEFTHFTKMDAELNLPERANFKGTFLKNVSRMEKALDKMRNWGINKNSISVPLHNIPSPNPRPTDTQPSLFHLAS